MSKGHDPNCCPPKDCNWCGEPITKRQGWARVTTTIFDKGHSELLEHWSDYHHNPGEMDLISRGLLQPHNADRPCLWHSQQ